MDTPRILVLSFSNLATDPRVNRQLRLLQGTCRLTAAGFADPGLSDVEFVPIVSTPKSWLGRLTAAWRLRTNQIERYYWEIGYVRNTHSALTGRKFDVIIANDADTWPLALALRGHGRVLFDAHEYAPREFEDLRRWRFFYQRYRTHLCREYLPHADAVTTVCAGIADEYAHVFKVRPEVVMNAPPLRVSEPAPVAGDRIRMIHHGAAAPSRRIETMIRSFDYLDQRFHLDLMLVGSDAAYLASLRALATSRPRVRFRPPVPMQEIPEQTRDYEIGLFLLEPTNFNYLHALPNKFFEFIQARLAIAIGPSPEMVRLVRQFDCGVIADDFTPVALARALETLTPEKIERFKQNSHRAADRLCWEQEGKILRRIVDRLLAQVSCQA